jgi:copper chaperone CopZ
VEVSVWEMHCQGCELEVEGAIGAVDGVAQVRADHESAVVRIELADAARREAVIPRIRDAIHANGRQVIGEDTLPPAGR